MTAVSRAVSTAILISGRGSNMSALIDAAAAPGFPARIDLVVSNRPDAAGLAHADAAGIETVVLDHAGFADKRAFETALHDTLKGRSIELICLAGFMRLLSADFLALWGDTIINIHPSLLPAFKGLETHRRALDAGVRIAGCTVHVVRPQMDAGPIIAQSAVPVMQNDTEDSLAARVLAAEHQLYPHALALVASGKVRVAGDKVIIDMDDENGQAASLLSPARQQAP